MENGNNNGFNNENQQFGNSTGNGFEGNGTQNSQQFQSGQQFQSEQQFQNGQQSQNGYEGQFNYGQNNYNQNNYGQNYGTPQPPMGDNGKELENRFGMKLTFSILEILMIFGCNLLTCIMGIIACVFTTKANTSFKEGRWDDFKSQAKTSAVLLWVGFAGFILELILTIVMVVAGVSFANYALGELWESGYSEELDEFDIEDDFDDFDFDEDESETTETETESEKSSSASTSTPSEVVAGTGFTDPTVTINGVTMTFPVTYADFKAMGFHISADDEAYVLNSMYYTSVTLYNSNDETIGYCYLYDHTENAIALSECMVYGVSIEYDSYYDVTTDVAFPSGVTMNSPKEDWVTAYGTPDYEYESEDYDSQDYQWYIHNDAYYDDSQNSLEISYWDGEIDEITIRYIGWE